MMQRIVYPKDDGVSVLIPCASSGLNVAEIARKDVPAGLPFLIVDASEIPEDRSQRDLWTADFSSPDGHGIGHEAWFAEQAALGIAK